MSVIAPPPPDERELLIREARARQRKRWLAVAVVVAVVAGAALGIDSILSSGNRIPATRGGSTPAVQTSKGCGVRVAWTKILDRSGHVLYREPASRTMGHQLQCNGSSIWVVFYNGVGMSQQAYFGVHSGDGGRTWKPVFTERYFGLKAPHQLDSYMGPWTLTPHAAYFVGLCPACSRRHAMSLWVTRDGGRRFRRYDVSTLVNGYWPTGIRVAGGQVTISSDWDGHRSAVTIHAA